MDYTSIQVTGEGPVRTITLNRPERRNAMTPAMQTELIAAFEEAAAGDCRVLVLTGAGEAFCSGLDLGALQDMQTRSIAETRSDTERIARLFRTLYDLPIPTIAAVRGPAIAGGAGLAVACDFALAAPEARFGFTEVRIGFIPAVVSAILELQIGARNCCDLLLTGRIVEAGEALHLGLIHAVVTPEELLQRVQTLASLLVQNSPQSLRDTKNLHRAQHREWLDNAMAAAIEASVESRQSGDFREGIAAFLEKRKPVWFRRQ